MYLRPDVCASCGKVIHDSSRFADHNQALHHFFGEQVVEHRPYFCCPEHIDREIERHLPDGFTTETAHAEQAIIDKAIDKYGKRVNPKIRPDKPGYMGAWLFLSPHRFDYWVNSSIQTKIRKLRARKKTEIESARTAAFKTFADKYVKARLETQAYQDQGAKWEQEKREIEVEKTKPILFSQHHVPIKKMWEHTHILGPQGSGKTTLLTSMMLKYITMEGPPALVLIDPKGFLARDIARLKILEGRNVVLIDPTRSTPPLNLFARETDPIEIGRKIEAVDYIFSQAGRDLSPIMRGVFKFCSRLLLSMPNATLQTFIEILQLKAGDSRFEPYIAKLSDKDVFQRETKQFFRKEYHDPLYAKTRDLMRTRFDEIRTRPQLMAAFTSPEPPINFKRLLKQRAIILVNTGMSTLGMDGSQLVGRYIISSVINAGISLGKDWPGALLMIDEFQDFVDQQKTSWQFRITREFKIGIVCGHQQMFDDNALTDGLRSTLSSCSVKYCAAVSGREKSYMTKVLGVEDAFLDQQVADENTNTVRFACVVRGRAPTSVTCTYPVFTPEMLNEEVSQPEPVQLDVQEEPEDPDADLF